MQLTKNKWLKPFIKAVLPQLYILAIVVGVFAVLIFLTRAPFYFFWYATQLSVFIWLCSLIIQWLAFKQRVERMEQLRTDDLELDQVSSLDDAYEAQYKKLEAEYMRYREETRMKEKEQMDYFTLWLHQIKTPISAMSLILEREASESPEKKQLELELISLNDYTHMALNYLKLEETGKELDLEKVQLDSVIKETIKKYSVLFIYNNISLDYSAIQTKVLTDRKWLQVLLEQLLSNSLKYTPSGTVRIYMESPEQLVIEDTGSGIRKEDLPKIFDKGYTGRDGRLHNKSTGLGLFLSQMVCKRLGHTLTIESEVGKGTKAIINFYRPDVPVFD